jgi:selenocysteine lyase/cysteine desulfurase
VVRGVPSTQVAKALTRDGIFASNGSFYATGVLDRLGHTQDGLMRAGCACYTTENEIDRLIEGVRNIAAA